ncbi:MAG: Cache 3/Cache 2 fusion domain-containing protein, partial [Rhodoferax sp.]|nr:Cache 3/Cache 2 fusion domain-containing protein [Rhodoferax sp.]
MSIKLKLFVFGLLGTAIPLLLFGSVTFWKGKANEGNAERESIAQATTGFDQIVKGIVAAVDTQQQMLVQQVDADLNVAANELSMAGGFSVGQDKIAWNAHNQLNSESQEVDLPQAFIGSELVTPNADIKIPSPVVDKMKSLVGGACSIFQRMNESGDMLRVISNVETKDGTRAINTFIPSKKPDGQPDRIVQAVLSGKRYLGRAFVVKEWFISAYEPLKDLNGKVVGMLAVAVPENITGQGAREKILATSVGKTGYVYVIDSKGRYVISQNGKRDGEDIWNFKDADGHFFIQEIVKKALTLKPGEIAEARYPWKNASDPTAQMKVVRFAYYAPWDWIIAAGAPEREIYQAAFDLKRENEQ